MSNKDIEVSDDRMIEIKEAARAFFDDHYNQLLEKCGKCKHYEPEGKCFVLHKTTPASIDAMRSTAYDMCRPEARWFNWED